MVMADSREEDHNQQHPLGFRNASPATMMASSSMSKESTSYDMGEFDQASIFLYLDGHDMPSIQEQRQTLNIFPSQPMYVGEPITTAKSGGVPMAMLANGIQQVPSTKRHDQQGGQKITVALPGPLPNSVKENKPSPVKKEGTSSGKGATSSCPDGEGRKTQDPKTLRRLAQNREAARKSRLRKKAYIQQLETSRVRLSQLEQQVHTARVQGVLLGNVDQQQLGLPSASSAGAMFEVEYARWVEEHSKLMFQVRGAVSDDEQVEVLVNAAVAHHDELLALKAAIARADVFHLLSGLWATPAERCFLWLGGFRPSDAIKIMLKHVETLSEGQLLGIYNMQQSLQETEDALNHGMETLQQSLSDTVAAPDVPGSSFMGHMSLAINKIESMESIVRQADGLRQQTLHKLRQMLTTRQAARCFVAISDYFHRLRALSTLWLARPRHPHHDAAAPPPLM